jgi:Mg-chelatase subunit ChlD
MKNFECVDISIVLDRSGSMESVREEAVSSFNKFLADQRAESGETALTLVQFDDEYEVVYDAVPLVDVPDLTQQRYVPRNCTALLDAIGKTTKHTDARLAGKPEDARPAKILFVVITDGMENASREYDSRTVFDLVSDRQDKGWRFVFLGANQDAIATASQFAVRPKDAMSIKSGKGSIACAMASLNTATNRYRKVRVSRPDASFFTDAERAANDPKDGDSR